MEAKARFKNHFKTSENLIPLRIDGDFYHQGRETEITKKY
jgi:hypothetical protein